MESALSAAYAHVYRQRWAGKHEQDRIDAQQWIDEFGPLVETIDRNKGNPVEERLVKRAREAIRSL